MPAERRETIVTVWAPQSPNELWYAINVLKGPPPLDVESPTAHVVRVVSAESAEIASLQRPPDLAIFLIANDTQEKLLLRRLQQLAALQIPALGARQSRLLVYVRASDLRGRETGRILKSLGLPYSVYNTTAEFRDQLKADWTRLLSAPWHGRAQSFHDQDGAGLAWQHKARPFRAFLCHSHGDKEPVRSLHDKLSHDGFAPWLDDEDLLPGQDWDAEIRKAVRDCQVVLVCLSRSSITKEGYVQREIKLALDVSEEKPPATIYIIPTRLEDCELPERLAKWHAVDLFRSNGYEKLATSLRARLTQLAAS
jgi:hypothetical protein